MAYGLSGTTLNSARLVRVLTDLAVTEPGDSKLSFAERLGQWLDFTDAMSLFSALNGPAGTSGGTEKAGAVAVDDLTGEFSRLRCRLADSINADGGLTSGKVRIKLPTLAPNTPADSAADFSPYHRYYLAHQRDMQASITPLRSKVRAVLGSRSPAQKRLAALDAALDEALSGRERDLLGTVPLLLAKRFAHLYKAHQATLGETSTTDDPSLWMQPGGWLAEFCAEMQGVLLAELDMRLQPVAGLIEALSNEVTE